MHIEHYPKYLELLKEAKSFLSDFDDTLLWKREEEVYPEEISLSFHPTISSVTVDSLLVSNLCTLCSRRISYKNKQFDQDNVNLPYLILIHNSFLGEYDRYFHDPKINQMFTSIITSTIGHEPKNFLIREVLRCHFGAEEVKEPQWFENCQKHILQDIQTYRIKGILIMGQAAPLIFSDKEYLKSAVGQVKEWQGVPTVVTPGPSRLVYMQKNNFAKEKIVQEKRNIFDAVKRFKEEVMKI